MIPHSRPVFDAAFAEALQRPLARGHVTAGEEARALEREAARALGRGAGVAVDSGASALMLALLALLARGGDPGARCVGIPAYACRALWHATRAAGCEPVCMDCGPDLRLDADKARALASSLDAVIVAHPFGMLEPLAAERWPCPVIEDAAQSAGGRLDGRPVGSFGDVAVVSFYATKPWGGAYGGLVAGEEDEPGGSWLEAIRQMRCADTADAALPHAGNHQLSDVHAALARARLARAGRERAARANLARRYDEWIEETRAEPVPREAEAAHFRYIVRAPDAGEAIRALRDRGVDARRPVETPLSRFTGADCPGAEDAWRHCVSLPLLADMSEEECERMREAIRACL